MHAFPTQQSQTARYRSAARGGHPYQSARHRAGSRSEIGDWLSLLLSLSIQEGAVMPNAPLAGSPQGAHLVMASYLRGQRLCYPQTISGPCPTSRSAGLVAAAGLGQATADQVTDGQQGDQEPALVGAEPLTVRGDVDRPGGDQDTEDRQYVDDQFGGLERRLGLPSQTTVAVSGSDSAVIADHVVMVGGAGGHASPSGDCDWSGTLLARRGIATDQMPAVFRPALIALCDLHRSETASEAFDLAIAAAVHVRSRIWFCDLLGAFVGVGIFAGNHHDVAVVHHSHMFTFARWTPWQQRFCAHVVVGERAPVAVPARVLQGAMQQVAVEDQGRAGGDLDRHSFVITVGKLIGLDRAVEPRVRLRVRGIEHSTAVGAR